MERASEVRYNYPQIEPSLKDALAAITYGRNFKDEKGQDFYSFYHEIIWYGVEAIAHVHLMREALAAARGEISQEEFFEKYKINKAHPSKKKFIAGFGVLEDDGIYLPPQRLSREIEVFSEDYLNNCGFPASRLRVPKPVSDILLKRTWQKEDFADEKLLTQGLALAKDLWAISTVEFSQSTREHSGRLALPKEATETGRKLIDYYWQIVEAEDREVGRPAPWRVYKRKNTKFTQVFMGEDLQLQEALQQYVAPDKPMPEYETIKVLKRSTRRKLADALINLDIFERLPD